MYGMAGLLRPGIRDVAKTFTRNGPRHKAKAMRGLKAIASVLR